MLLVVCSAIAALGCRDIERPVARPISAATQVQQGAPVIAASGCAVNGTANTTVCKPLAAPPPGANPSVIYGAPSRYATLTVATLVKDNVAHTWQLSASVKNLMTQSIGTLNGTTATGVKVFIVAVSATTGTGTVSVANPDGMGTLTAANQPYFNYNQIVAAGATTANKAWKFNVPAAVTAIIISALVSTDFPAEQNVAIKPPVSVPAWVHADTSISAPTAAVHVRFVKRIVVVHFKKTATLADRQLAIAYVNGTVVGGRLDGGNADGNYFVQVPDDGTGGPLTLASMKLSHLSQVEMAIPEVIPGSSWLKPLDGGDWNNWTLSPDSVNTTKKNWAPELINAPFAWGCSTGDPSISVGVIDRGFRRPSDLIGNIPSSGFIYTIKDSVQHGTEIASIIAAKGNSGATSNGMAGMMWSANLRLEDATRDTLGTDTVRAGGTDAIAIRVLRLAKGGVRIINISSGESWSNGYVPKDSVDSALAVSISKYFMNTVRYLRPNFNVPLPLLVFSAGNYTSGSVDSWWSGFPQLRDSLGDTVIVVGASDASRTLASWSARNITHNYVEIVAPGANAWALDSNNVLHIVNGTSYAAPHVTGVGGMLLAFDTRLNSTTIGFGPPELKRLIIAGADSSRNPVTNAKRTSGGIRYLDAYESLKEAARRSGAPLCANRVYAPWNWGQTYVQRATGDEWINTVPGLAYAPSVFHGGKQISFAMGVPQTGIDPSSPYYQHYYGDNYVCYALTWGTNGAWALSPPRCDSRDPSVGSGLPPLVGSYSGTHFSSLGKSHSGDSAITVSRCAGTDSTCFNANLVTSSSRVLATFHQPAYRTDVWQYGYYATVAYSPYGDRALVSFSQYIDSSFSENAIPYYVYAHVYSIKISNGAITDLGSWNTGTRGIFSLGLSEDGRTAVAAIGNAVGAYWLDNGATCTIEYRQYSGSNLSPTMAPFANPVAPVTNPDGCYGFSGPGVDSFPYRRPGTLANKVIAANSPNASTPPNSLSTPSGHYLFVTRARRR